MFIMSNPIKPRIVGSPLALLLKPSYQSMYFSSSFFQKYSTKKSVTQIIEPTLDDIDVKDAVLLLQNEFQLRQKLTQLNQSVISSYLYENFIFWLHAYAREFGSFCEDYFTGSMSLNELCKSFIRFCFHKGISLDPTLTLASFKRHNELADNAIKKEVDKLIPKDEVQILGFGLDEGHFEQDIVKYLLFSKKAKRVNLFGFDPYAKKNPAIRYLSEDELRSGMFNFDLIIARWVLHHVEMRYRWSTFVDCMLSCRSGAKVYIVEHGYWENISPFNRKLSHLLNGTFDVIANIGLRPNYFLNSAHIGDNFFIEYLEPKDITNITAQINSEANIYHIGASLPNQTIIEVKIKK